MSFHFRYRASAAMLATAATAVLGAFALTGQTLAQDSVEDFYRGRTIDFIISTSPGGSYDAYARLVARFLPNHIPGNPTIIPRNMPGASHRVAANFVYNVAPQDGTVLATAEQSLALAQAIGDPGITFDVSAFNYLGAPSSDNNVMFTWHTSGVANIDDARERSINVGATGGSSSSQLPTLLNEFAGTQFNIITGYPGGSDVNFAMESGEVDARGSWNWVALTSTQPHWLSEGLVNVIVQSGLEKEADLPDVPLLWELGETEEDRALLRLVSSPVAIGRPVFTTPNVPQERVDALRAAFEAMVVDPEFLAAAEAEGLNIAPVTGERLEEIIGEILSSPPELTERLAAIFVAE